MENIPFPKGAALFDFDVFFFNFPFYGGNPVISSFPSHCFSSQKVKVKDGVIEVCGVCFGGDGMRMNCDRNAGRFRKKCRKQNTSQHDQLAW